MKRESAQFLIVIGIVVLLMVGVAIIAIDYDIKHYPTAYDQEVDAWHNPNPDTLKVGEVIGTHYIAREASYLKITIEVPTRRSLYYDPVMEDWIDKQHADSIYEVTVKVNDCTSHFTLQEFLELINCEE